MNRDASLLGQEKKPIFTVLINQYLSQLLVGIHSKELLGLLVRENLLVLDYILVQVLRIDLNRLVLLVFLGLENVLNLPHIVAALESPAVRIFSGMINCHSSTSFLGHVIALVFAVHVLLHEVAPFVLEILAVQREDFSEEASLHLLCKTVRRIPIEKIAFTGGLCVQIEEGEVFSRKVRVHDDSFDCVNRAVLLQ